MLLCQRFELAEARHGCRTGSVDASLVHELVKQLLSCLAIGAQTSSYHPFHDVIDQLRLLVVCDCVTKRVERQTEGEVCATTQADRPSRSIGPPSGRAPVVLLRACRHSRSHRIAMVVGDPNDEAPWVRDQLSVVSPFPKVAGHAEVFLDGVADLELQLRHALTNHGRPRRAKRARSAVSTLRTPTSQFGEAVFPRRAQDGVYVVRHDDPCEHVHIKRTSRGVECSQEHCKGLVARQVPALPVHAVCYMPDGVGVIAATVGMYGDLQGIAGQALEEIEGLELPLLDGPEED